MRHFKGKRPSHFCVVSGETERCGAYEFDVPDTGTYSYHPYQRSHEQVGRGLHRALIVEEREPIMFDRDMV
jgi:FtsP/CotA-like multicopper oxidase with cupredoxin domain